MELETNSDGTIVKNGPKMFHPRPPQFPREEQSNAEPKGVGQALWGQGGGTHKRLMDPWAKTGGTMFPGRKMKRATMELETNSDGTIFAKNGPKMFHPRPLHVPCPKLMFHTPALHVPCANLMFNTPALHVPC